MKSADRITDAEVENLHAETYISEPFDKDGDCFISLAELSETLRAHRRLMAMVIFPQHYVKLCMLPTCRCDKESRSF